MRRPAHLRPVLFLALALLVASPRGDAQAPGPVVGRSIRYCNPLPIEASSRDGSPQGVGLGDVTVVREGGKYYLFATGGGGWVSDDLVNWRYQGVEMREGRVPVAPHVVKYNGQFYMSGNNAPLYRAPAILGPYEVAGDWTDVSGRPFAGVSNGRPWVGAFDVDIFVDDDNKPYLYFPGRSTDGIYVVPLDPSHLNRFTAEPKRLFGFDPSHVWERYGEMNEYPDVSWIEGPWMLKRRGTYYLQYSASGTQWLTYATGMYTGKSPMGPFTYAPVNPILRKTTGIVTGTAHGSIVEGPDGNLWQFYTIVMSNPPGGRRVGMDPVGFDAAGKSLRPGAERNAAVGTRRGGRSGAARRFGFASADDRQDARDEHEEHVLEPAPGPRGGLRRRQLHRHLVGASRGRSAAIDHHRPGPGDGVRSDPAVHR